MGFRALRVINDDRVQPGQGFGTHGHADMEILSYVLEGGLAHKDSMGTGSVIRPGEIQMMRAGTGVTHSEYNASQTEPVHFLQIWIVPDERGLPPAYGQRPVTAEAARRGFALLASKDGREESLRLQPGRRPVPGSPRPGPGPRAARSRPGRHAWIHVARGSATVNGTALGEGDGAAVSGTDGIALESAASAEVLIFDLA